MKRTNVVVWLALSIALMVLFAAGGGLFWELIQPDDGTPFSYETVRGEMVQFYGHGLYRYDSLMIGAGFKGQDTVMLLLGLPLLVLSALRYHRDARLGKVLLFGVLGYVLYVYASMAFGAAYNSLFLLYIVLFSASLFAFGLLFAKIDLQLFTSLSKGFRRRGLAIFLTASALLTSVVWLEPLVSALLQGQPPSRLDGYTTMITDVLDLGIIVPALFIAAGLLFRRDPLGYLLAVPLLTLIVLLLPTITLATVYQLRAGIIFAPGEFFGPITGFLVLGAIAGWFLVSLLHNLTNAPTAQYGSYR